MLHLCYIYSSFILHLHALIIYVLLELYAAFMLHLFFIYSTFTCATAQVFVAFPNVCFLSGPFQAVHRGTPTRPRCLKAWIFLWRGLPHQWRQSSSSALVITPCTYINPHICTYINHHIFTYRNPHICTYICKSSHMYIHKSSNMYIHIYMTATTVQAATAWMIFQCDQIGPFERYVLVMGVFVFFWKSPKIGPYKAQTLCFFLSEKSQITFQISFSQQALFSGLHFRRVFFKYNVWSYWFFLHSYVPKVCWRLCFFRLGPCSN
jgi:hypothetical protein